MSRSREDDVKYGVRAENGLRAWAWRSNGSAHAVSVPRNPSSGGHLLPYSCAPGHVTAWMLWYDILADATGDLVLAARLAGLLEADMGALLRDRGEVTFTGRQIAAWAALMAHGERALRCV